MYKGILLLALILLGSINQSTAQEERKPIYPCGLLQIQKDIVSALLYPNEALDNGVEGQLMVSFVFNKAGYVDDIRLSRRMGYGLDEAAIAAVSQLKRAEPATLNGKPTEYKYSVPIYFKMGEGKKSNKSPKVKEAAYPGGREKVSEDIQKALVYPSNATKSDIPQVVYLDLFVDKMGEIADIQVVRGINPEFDAAAIKTVSSLKKFQAATKNNRAVSYTYSIPVIFEAEQEKAFFKDSIEVIDGDTIYNFVDVEAEYSEDYNVASAIARQFIYPQIAIENGISGSMIFKLIITDKGEVAYMEHDDCLGYGLEEEAIKAIKKLRKFKPAIKDGRAVWSKLIVPVICKLE